MNKSVLLIAAGLLGVNSLSANAADLLDIYRQSLDSDAQLRAAIAGHEATLTLRKQARAAVMPKLSASASQGPTDTEYVDYAANPALEGTTRSTDQSRYSLSVVQPLFNWEAFVAMGQTGDRIDQSQAQLAAEQQGHIIRVANAYFGVLAALDGLEAARAEQEAVQQQLRQAQQRFDVGLSAITDVHEAQARYDLTVAQEIAAENQLYTAREQLREITGQYWETLATLGRAPLIEPEPADITAWVETALDRNPQLAALRSAAEAARAEVRKRKAGRYPTLDLVGSYEHSEGSVFGQQATTNSQSVMLQLNAPFFQGGFIGARAEEAAWQHQQTLEQLELQRRATERQVRDAFRGVTAGISQVEALRQSLRSAETAVEATQAGFEVGTRTAVDVLNAQQQLYRARRDLAQARYNYVMASLGLKQAAGVLNGTDLEAINSWLK